MTDAKECETAHIFYAYRSFSQKLIYIFIKNINTKIQKNKEWLTRKGLFLFFIYFRLVVGIVTST